MKYFEDLKLQETLTTRARTITESDIVNFCGLSGDFYPLHTDKEYAARSPFGQRIAHGFLILSIASGLLPLYDLAIEAFYGIDRLRFIRPVYIGDTIHCALSVSEKIDKGTKGGVVAFKQDIFKQKDDLVCHLIFKTLFKKRDDPQSPKE